MVSVSLPPALLRLFPGATPRAEIDAANVAEMLAELDRRWPGMRDRLCDSRPRIRRNINIFVEGRRAGLETPLPPGCEVSILTAIIG